MATPPDNAMARDSTSLMVSSILLDSALLLISFGVVIDSKLILWSMVYGRESLALDVIPGKFGHIERTA